MDLWTLEISSLTESPLLAKAVTGESVTNIFVGNLSYQTTEAELETAFGAFGAVERVSIVRDRDTGQPRGFAFVEMTNADQAASAIQGLNGTEMGGRAINVNEARPREERGGGGNRFGGGGGGRGPKGGGFGRKREPRW
jgi:RNA recognition motif-containing protein